MRQKQTSLRSSNVEFSEAKVETNLYKLTGNIGHLARAFSFAASRLHPLKIDLKKVPWHGLLTAHAL